MTAERLLLGPGPSAVSARVMRAMGSPVLSHLDPEMMVVLDDLRRRLDRRLAPEPRVQPADLRHRHRRDGSGGGERHRARRATSRIIARSQTSCSSSRRSSACSRPPVTARRRRRQRLRRRRRRDRRRPIGGERPYNVNMRRRSWMRTAWRALAVLLAAGFACAAYIYLTLPDVRVLRTQNPPTTAFIELRTQEAIEKGEQPRRIQRWVSYARISPSLKRAVIVTEDAAFWQHGGVDFQQLKESMEVNLERMEFARGASTITQQLAKNLYLSPSKNPIRKGREMPHRATARSRALEAAHPRALSEPHRVGQRHLRRRGRCAHVLPQSCGRARAPGVGAAGRRDQQPESVRSGPAQRAPAPPAGDDPAPDGRRDAAARYC